MAAATVEPESASITISAAALISVVTKPVCTAAASSLSDEHDELGDGYAR